LGLGLVICLDSLANGKVLDNEYIIIAEKDKPIEGLIKKQEQFEQLLQSLIDSGQLKSVKVEN
jgi:hypothetical protein